MEMGVDKGPGRLSLRMGEVLRDVCGLLPVEGSRLEDGCFRSDGRGVGVVEDEEVVFVVGVEEDVCRC